MSDQKHDGPCDCAYCSTKDITGPVDIAFDSNTGGLVMIWPKALCRMEMSLHGAYELSNALCEALIAAETIIESEVGGIN